MKLSKLLATVCLGALLTAQAYAVSPQPAGAKNALVLMTDFGTSDGAVSAMHGVAFGVDPTLQVSDLTHNIPDYDIWLGAYRLYQTANYWPKGSVFVSVIDPGVGTARKSVVLKTKEGRYFVGPDNGLFTLIAERDGVAELREIDGWPPQNWSSVIIALPAPIAYESGNHAAMMSMRLATPKYPPAANCHATRPLRKPQAARTPPAPSSSCSSADRGRKAQADRCTGRWPDRH